MNKHENGKIVWFAAIMFIIAMVIEIKNFVNYQDKWDLFYAVAYYILTMAVLVKRKAICLIIGMGIYTCCEIVTCITYFDTNSIYKFPTIISLLGAALAMIIIIVGITNNSLKVKNVLKKICVIPAVFTLSEAVLRFINYYNYLSEIGLDYYGDEYYNILFNGIRDLALYFIPLSIGILFSMLLVVNLNQKSEEDINDNTVQSYMPFHEEAYFSLSRHIFLLLFTFGVWQLFWIYYITKYTNHVEGEEDRTPAYKLLLCMFIPFYMIYWNYKTAQRVDKVANLNGVASDLSVLCLVFSFFVPIIPPIVIQSKINGVIKSGNNVSVKNNIDSNIDINSKADINGNIGNNTAIGQEIRKVNDVAEALKKYKELLDSGIITQEEFEMKKKQLLNL